MNDITRHGHLNVCPTCKPAFLQKLREGAVSVGVMEYAGFWIRAGASIVDSLITGVLGSIIGFLFGIGAPPGDSPEQILTAQGAASGVGFLIGMAYYVFFNGKFGATPGKMVCGIKIVTEEGMPIGYGRAFGRYFASILSGLLCGVGYLMVAFDDEILSLHDRICRTRVI